MRNFPPQAMIIFSLFALNLSHCWAQSHGQGWDFCSSLLVGRRFERKGKEEKLGSKSMNVMFLEQSLGDSVPVFSW